MPNKVIHVSDDVHTIVKRFCTNRNVDMSRWVRLILLDAVERNIIAPDKKIVEKIGPLLSSQRVEVVEHENPFTQPPFWANKDEPADS